MLITPAPAWTAAVIACTTTPLELLPVELKMRTEKTGLPGDTPCIAPGAPAATDATSVPCPSWSGTRKPPTTSWSGSTRPASSGTFGSTPVSRIAMGLVAPLNSASAAFVEVAIDRSGCSGAGMHPVGACCALWRAKRRSTCAAMTCGRRDKRCAIVLGSTPRGTVMTYVGDPSGSVPERTPPAGECASRSTATSTRRPCAAGAAAAKTAIARIAPAAGSFDMSALPAEVDRHPEFGADEDRQWDLEAVARLRRLARRQAGDHVDRVRRRGERQGGEAAVADLPLEEERLVELAVPRGEVGAVAAGVVIAHAQRQTDQHVRGTRDGAAREQRRGTRLRGIHRHRRRIAGHDRGGYLPVAIVVDEDRRSAKVQAPFGEVDLVVGSELDLARDETAQSARHRGLALERAEVEQGIRAIQYVDRHRHTEAVAARRRAAAVLVDALAALDREDVVAALDLDLHALRDIDRPALALLLLHHDALLGARHLHPPPHALDDALVLAAGALDLDVLVDVDLLVHGHELVALADLCHALGGGGAG